LSAFIRSSDKKRPDDSCQSDRGTCHRQAWWRLLYRPNRAL